MRQATVKSQDEVAQALLAGGPERTAARPATRGRRHDGRTVVRLLLEASEPALIVLWIVAAADWGPVSDRGIGVGLLVSAAVNAALHYPVADNPIQDRARRRVGWLGLAALAPLACWTLSRATDTSWRDIGLLAAAAVGGALAAGLAGARRMACDVAVLAFALVSLAP